MAKKRFPLAIISTRVCQPRKLGNINVELVMRPTRIVPANQPTTSFLELPLYNPGRAHEFELQLFGLSPQHDQPCLTIVEGEYPYEQNGKHAQL